MGMGLLISFELELERTNRERTTIPQKLILGGSPKGAHEESKSECTSCFLFALPFYSRITTSKALCDHGPNPFTPEN
eukprot:scaffold6206_cov238-Isochrysis_galbana.AAC.5